MVGFPLMPCRPGRIHLLQRNRIFCGFGKRGQIQACMQYMHFEFRWAHGASVVVDTLDFRRIELALGPFFEGKVFL